MRLLVAALTGPLFYVSVKSASIGSRPCIDPVGCAGDSPRCIKCPDAGEKTPGYCSFLDPAWQTDLCFNPGYAQFCPNACVERHSISAGLTPANGIRGPINSGSTPGTSPGATQQSNPVTVPDTTPGNTLGNPTQPVPVTVPESTPGVNPENVPGTVPETIPSATPDTVPGTTPSSVPLTLPDIPGKVLTPAEQLGTPGSDQISPGASSQPSGPATTGNRKNHRRPKPGSTGSGSTPDSRLTPGSGSTPGSAPTAGDGSTMEVVPTLKNQEIPPDQSTTPSSGVPESGRFPPPSSSGARSGQPLQFPTGTGPVPDSQFLNNGDGNGNSNPIPGNPIQLTPDDMGDAGGRSNSKEQHQFTPPALAFADVGVDGSAGASQGVSPFSFTDASVTS